MRGFFALSFIGRAKAFARAELEHFLATNFSRKRIRIITGAVDNLIEEQPFKVTGEIRLMAVTQKQLAQALHLSPTRANELTQEKIFVRDEMSRSGQVMLFESLKNYFLSKKSTDEGVNYWLEKARHEKAKRELAELKLSKERGESYDAGEVEAAWLELIADFKQKLLGLGHKISSRLEGLSSGAMCAIIDAEIELALKELTDDDGPRLNQSEPAETN